MMRLSARRSRAHFERSPGRIPFAELRALTPEKLAEALTGAPGETIRWVAAAARYSLVEGQLLLGQCLLDGRGLPGDPRAALRWFEAAAGAGNLKAMNMVGRCHEMGWGTPMDPHLAADWYRRAAEGGLDWSQYNLGNLLLRGCGVLRDRAQALSWYLRAARQGHAKSMNLVGRFCEEGWEMPPDLAAAHRWYRCAAERGDFRAQFNLGTLLAKQDRFVEATEWLRAAVLGATPDVVRLAAGTLLQSSEPAMRDVGYLALKRLADCEGAALPERDRGDGTKGVSSLPPSPGAGMGRRYREGSDGPDADC
jgi:TPR repeat protein